MATISDCQKELLLQAYLEWCHSEDHFLVRITANFARLYLYDKCVCVEVTWDGSRWNEARRRAIR